MRSPAPPGGAIDFGLLLAAGINEGKLYCFGKGGKSPIGLFGYGFTPPSANEPMRKAGNCCKAPFVGFTAV